MNKYMTVDLSSEILDDDEFKFRHCKEERVLNFSNRFSFCQLHLFSF